MYIRRAECKDIPRINDLLLQVLNIHAKGRPDIFIPNTRKYRTDELEEIIKDDSRPIFVALDEENIVQGYAFCIYEEVKNSNNLHDMKSLYIDDLCVDSACRGKHIGTELYNYVCDEAKRNGCYRITLNVWCLNTSSMKFYESMGMDKLKIVMEKVLD